MLDPTLVQGTPGFFVVQVQNPVAGPAATGGSLTFPNGTSKNLLNQIGLFRITATFPTEAAMDAAFPEGSYTLRFSQTGQPERVIPLTMPAAPVAIPKITNYDEAQALDATKDFTPKWNAFTPQGPGAFLRLIITDEGGKLIFMAPNPCVPRTLESTDTSIVIPVKYFRPGVKYEGLLVFGFNFYNSITDVPQMAGYGVVQRSTSFPLNAAGGDDNGTGTGTGTVAPAKFTNHRVLENGHSEFNLSGTVGKIYTIQRAANLTSPTWSPVGPVTMNASGIAVFEDTDSALKFASYYRAVGN